MILQAKFRRHVQIAGERFRSFWHYLHDETARKHMQTVHEPGSVRADNEVRLREELGLVNEGHRGSVLVIKHMECQAGRLGCVP